MIRSLITLAGSALLACVALFLGVVSAGHARAGEWEDAQAAFVDLDDRRGLELLERGAQAGDARAQLAWGLALHHGGKVFPGLAANPQAAKAWLFRAAAAAPLTGTIDAVPAAKRTRLGLYLNAADVPAFKQAKAPAMLFIDIRTRAEATYVGMPDAADLLLPYMEHEEFDHEWDAKRATFRPASRAGFAADLAQALAHRSLGRDTPLVLMCRSGDRSAKAADLLAELGYGQVYSVIDGFEGDLSADGRRSVNGWKNAGLPWSYQLDPMKVGLHHR
jgi:rhodanese-related sulfurtransferase